jgi:hypothetical protein
MYSSGTKMPLQNSTIQYSTASEGQIDRLDLSGLLINESVAPDGPSMHGGFAITVYSSEVEMA